MENFLTIALVASRFLLSPVVCMDSMSCLQTLVKYSPTDRKTVKIRIYYSYSKWKRRPFLKSSSLQRYCTMFPLKPNGQQSWFLMHFFKFLYSSESEVFQANNGWPQPKQSQQGFYCRSPLCDRFHLVKASNLRQMICKSVGEYTFFPSNQR